MYYLSYITCACSCNRCMISVGVGRLKRYFPGSVLFAHIENSKDSVVYSLFSVVVREGICEIQNYTLYIASNLLGWSKALAGLRAVLLEKSTPKQFRKVFFKWNWRHNFCLNSIQLCSSRIKQIHLKWRKECVNYPPHLKSTHAANGEPWHPPECGRGDSVHSTTHTRSLFPALLVSWIWRKTTTCGSWCERSASMEKTTGQMFTPTQLYFSFYGREKIDKNVHLLRNAYMPVNNLAWSDHLLQSSSRSHYSFEREKNLFTWYWH